MIAHGRVRVNGVVARIGQSIDPTRDRIEVDGKPVGLVVVSNRWFLLNKPRGVMTTRRDPEGRRTVFDLVPPVPGLTYVGRLDFLTEGVLLFTTDGEAAHRLTHPSSEVERVYVATVTGNVKSAAEQARRGVELDDGIVRPEWVEVRPLTHRRWEFEIALREGRTREVRRLCEALGLTVERLVRTRFGPVVLGTLGSGEVRELSPRERSVITALHAEGIPKRVSSKVAPSATSRGARKSRRP